MRNPRVAHKFLRLRKRRIACLTRRHIWFLNRCLAHLESKQKWKFAPSGVKFTFRLIISSISRFSCASRHKIWGISLNKTPKTQTRNQNHFWRLNWACLHPWAQHAPSGNSDNSSMKMENALNFPAAKQAAVAAACCWSCLGHWPAIFTWLLYFFFWWQPKP